MYVMIIYHVQSYSECFKNVFITKSHNVIGFESLSYLACAWCTPKKKNLNSVKSGIFLNDFKKFQNYNTLDQKTFSKI